MSSKQSFAIENDVIDLKGWTPITQEMPPVGEFVLYCCRIDGEFGYVYYGAYEGQMTLGGRCCVMEYGDDWNPCEFWMRLPEMPVVTVGSGSELHLETAVNSRVEHEREQSRRLLSLSSDSLRLMFGELNADEIRLIRAVLKYVAGVGE